MGYSNQLPANSSRSTLISLALVIAVYATTLGLAEKRGFWITDNANKFLQARAFIENGYADSALPWPGRIVDPELSFNPLPYYFTRVRDGELYSIFPPFFAFASSLLFSLLGHWGLYILPSVASLLMLWGLAKIASLVDARPAVAGTAVLLAGLCTPVWFYGVVFWEHSTAVCLCVWSIWFALQFARHDGTRDLLFSFICAGLAVYFRDELYLWFLLLVAWSLTEARRNRGRIPGISAVAGTVTLLPLWIFQWKVTGDPFGQHLSSHLSSAPGLLAHLADRPRVVYNLFLATNPVPALSLLLTIPLVVGLVWQPALGAAALQRFVPLVALGALVGLGLSLGGYFVAESPIDYMLRSSNMLFAAAPIAVLACVRRAEVAEGGGPGRSIWRLALGFALLYLLFAPQLGSMGIHWGNRFLLLLYPLLALGAASNLVSWWEQRRPRVSASTLAVIALIALSLGAQLYSIGLLHERKSFSHRLNREVGRMDEQIVITNERWVPHSLHAHFYQRLIFYVAGPQQFSDLLDRLSETGYESYLFVAPYSARRAGEASAEVMDEGLGFFAVQLFVEDIAGAAE